MCKTRLKSVDRQSSRTLRSIFPRFLTEYGPLVSLNRTEGDAEQTGLLILKLVTQKASYNCYFVKHFFCTHNLDNVTAQNI